MFSKQVKNKRVHKKSILKSSREKGGKFHNGRQGKNINVIQMLKIIYDVQVCS